jgi:predicted nucleic acid-binding protein
MTTIPARYWDSATFLGWLNQEESKFDLCDSVIAESKEGKWRIVTSALTYAEVYWTKRGVKLSTDQQRAITDLFEYSWIIPVDLDRMTAELARTIMWKHPHIKSWDAVHVACAIKIRRLGQIECFDTFDGDLIGLTGKLDGTDLRLSTPDLPPRFPLLAGTRAVNVASSVPAPPSGQSLAAETTIAQPSAPAPPSGLPGAPAPQPPGSSPPVPPPSRSTK